MLNRYVPGSNHMGLRTLGRWAYHAVTSAQKRPYIKLTLDQLDTFASDAAKRRDCLLLFGMLGELRYRITTPLRRDASINRIIALLKEFEGIELSQNSNHQEIATAKAELLKTYELRSQQAVQKALDEQARKEEAARQDALAKQARKEEAARQDALAKQARKEEAARQDALAKQARKEEEARQKAAEEQARKEEAARQDALAKQARKEEEARQKAAEEQARKEEAARQDALAKQARKERSEVRREAEES